MNFSLNDEQMLFKESVENFVAKEFPSDQRRFLNESEEGFSRDHWACFAELGWLGLSIAEQNGGLGGSALDLALLMEGFGRGLAPSPYLASVVLGGEVVERAGSSEQKAAILPALVAGEMLLAFAYAEQGGRYDLARIQVRAEKKEQSWLLYGQKSVVFYAQSADKLIVSAAAAEGISLFLLDSGASGLKLRSYPTIDGLRAAEVILDGAFAQPLGAPGEALPVIQSAVDRATIAVCAEALGIMNALIEMTLAYVAERKQFGTAIGKFQVLQHALVDMYMAQELSKSLTYRAAAALAAEDSGTSALAASAAKVQIGKAGRLIGQQAVQLHGGMGMTDEFAIGHYFKRLAMIETLFGDTDHHRRRFASLAKE
tara:strand:- start:365 stop:1477 length:1113 start_codon:yes stop_codon:yes gene_type:complete